MLRNKNTKFSNKYNHVANYISQRSHSEKIACNIKPIDKGFFYAPTLLPLNTLFAKIEPLGHKKTIRRSKRLSETTNQDYEKRFNTSGTTAPKIEKRKQKIEKIPPQNKKEPYKKFDYDINGNKVYTTYSRKNLTKRARAKHFTDLLIKPMFWYAQKNNSPLLQQYKNILECNRVLLQDGDTLKGTYCSNKACQVCSRIRTARLIDAYEMPIKELSEDSNGSDFVTLTIKNCKAENLKDEVKKMIKIFTLINRKLRERYGLDTWGVRQLECTYNKTFNEYHPHFHIVCPKNMGNIFVDEWLKHNPISDRKGQNIKNFDGNFKELFKYATKIVDVQKKDSYEIDPITGKKVININLKALDTILQAFTGVRITQSFGALSKIKVDENLNKDNVAQSYTDLPVIPQPPPQIMTVVNDNGELVEEWVELPPKPMVKWWWIGNDWYFEASKNCDVGALAGYNSNNNLIYKFYDK